MDFLFLTITFAFAIHLYFLDNRSSLVLFYLISISLLLFSLYRIYDLRLELIASLDSVFSRYSAFDKDSFLNIFDYSTISIFSLVIILILLSNIFLLNKKNVSLMYIIAIGVTMLLIPIYSYLYALTFNNDYFDISWYLFRSASYQSLLLQVPFLVKKTFNYFKYTSPFFNYETPILIK